MQVGLWFEDEVVPRIKIPGDVYINFRLLCHSLSHFSAPQFSFFSSPCVIFSPLLLSPSQSLLHLLLSSVSPLSSMGFSSQGFLSLHNL